MLYSSGNSTGFNVEQLATSKTAADRNNLAIEAQQYNNENFGDMLPCITELKSNQLQY